MSEKEITYKLNLSGGDITVKDRSISEQIALKIIALVMGGAVGSKDSSASNASPQDTRYDADGADGDQPNPKVFMAQKKPTSEIERITCLAYYLNRYRNTRAFKTRDLTKLNTEAAQPNFSNATIFARNADMAGYLSKAGGGNKQIAMLGEAVVEALPNREKVIAAIENNKVGSKRRTGKKSRKTHK